MAANQVGQVEIRVVPDGSQFGPQLQAILDAAAGKAGAAGRAIGQNISQQVVPQMQTVNRTVMDAGMQFDIAARKALVFTGAVMGTKAAVEGMVGKLARLFDQLAQAQAGFSAIIGEKRGKNLLDDIRQFAKESPFVTQQLVNYSQQLLGVGMNAEKIVPLLKDTGNVIASVGGDTANLSRVLYAMSQIQTVGRLMGQDAMQLQASLIPITKLLAQYLGKSTQEVKKLQEQGRISADQVFAAISAAGQKVPHAMDNAVRNIAGARAVLSDTITILMQDSPALRKIFDDVVKAIQLAAKTLDSPEVRGAITNAFDSVGRVYEEVKPVIESFVKTMGQGALVSVKSFSVVLDTLAGVLNMIPKPMLEALARILAAIATLKAPLMLYDYVKQFGKMAEIFKTGGMLTNMNTAFKKMAEGDAPTKTLTTSNQQLAASYIQVAEAASAASMGISGSSQASAAALAGRSMSTGAMAAALSGGPAVEKTAAATETAIVPSEALSSSYETMRTQMLRKQAEQKLAMSREDMLNRKQEILDRREGRIAAIREMRTAPGGLGLIGPGGLIGRGWDSAKSTQLSGKQIMGTSIGFSVAGGILQSSENKSVQAVGNMASMTGMGMMVGGFPGAIAGTVIGAITSITSALKELREMQRQAWDAIIKTSSDAFIARQQRLTGDMTGATAAAIQERIGFYNKIVTRAQTAYEVAQTRTYPTGTDATLEIQNAKKYAEDAKKLYGAQAIELQAKLDEMFGISAGFIKNIFGGASPTEGIGKMFPGLFEQKTVIGPGGVGINTGAPEVTDDYAKMDAALKVYGLSLEKVGILGEEATKRIIDGLNMTTESTRRAYVAAVDYNAVMAKAKTAAEELYGPEIQMLKTKQSLLSAGKEAITASTAAFKDQTNEALQLQSQIAILEAKKAKYMEVAQAETDRLRRQTILGAKWTDAQIEEMSGKKAAIEAEKVTKEFQVLSLKSVDEMAKTYGYSNEEMQKLLGLQGKIDKNMKITVTVAIDEAMKKLAELNNAIEVIGRNLDNVYKYGATGNFAMNFKKMESLGVSAAQTKKYISDQVERQTGAKSGGGGGQSFEDKVKSAAAALENSIKSAMDAVKGAAEAWEATIKERVQYEEAVGVGRAIRNAQRQATDISFLTTGIAQLKARGLTEEALTALDINSITDVRQVKRLLSSSPEELKRLSSTVAQRDKLASTLASDRQQEQNRKTITQAILEAARILGYKFTEEQAKAISAEFNITTETDAKKMIEDILKALSGGKITSVPT